MKKPPKGCERDRALCVTISCRSAEALLGFATMSEFGEFQLLYPDATTSSRPIMEFRARPKKWREFTTDKPTPGHAFVFLGRELDNGLTVFYGAAGFYPENNTLKNVLDGPGTVTYKIPDMLPEEAFRLNISEYQESLVKYIIKNWDDKRFKLASDNCVEMAKDVADAVGVRHHPSLKDVYPQDIVDNFKQLNDRDTPLRHAVREAKRMGKLRNAASREAQGIIQRQREFWQRIHDAQREREFSDSIRVYSPESGSTPGFGVPFGGVDGNYGAGGRSGSEDVDMSLVYPAWPWPEPR